MTETYPSTHHPSRPPSAGSVASHFPLPPSSADPPSVGLPEMTEAISAHQQQLALLSSCLGLWSDLYFLCLLNLLKDIVLADPSFYWTSPKRHALPICIYVGTVSGQIGSGCLADHFGRKSICLITWALMMTGAIISASAFTYKQIEASTILLIGQFILGVGIGGEYPLAASVVSESSSAESSGRRISIAYSMMGIGSVVSPMVLYCLFLGGVRTHLSWRIALLIGCIPSITTLVIRLKMKESNRFSNSQQQVDHEEEKPLVQPCKVNCSSVVSPTTSSPIENCEDGECEDGEGTGLGGDKKKKTISSDISTRDDPSLIDSSPMQDSHSDAGGRVFWCSTYRRWLIGTMVSWFLYDIVIYGLGTFLGRLTKSMKLGNQVIDETRNTTIIGLIGVPGHFGAILAVEFLGRKKSQMSGFFAAGVCFGTLSCLLLFASTPAFMKIALLGLGVTFSAAGPGMATYVIPGELFPTRCRARCHGLSAAAGKVGAVTGSFLFEYLVEAAPFISVLVASMVSFAGTLWTVFFTPQYTVAQLTHRWALEEDRNGSKEFKNTIETPSA